jgi:opacity protein-like surface antigen
MIKYANGEKEVFNAEKTSSKQTTRNVSQSTNSASAKGDIVLGGHLAFDRNFHFGLGGKFRYNAAEQFRLEASYTYLFPKKEKLVGDEISFSVWDFAVNGHYLFSISDKIVIYPLAGLSVLGGKVKATYRGHSEAEKADPKLYFNLGVGADFKLNDRVVLNAEPKLIIGEGKPILLISTGIMYHF